jgi:hypothetical protein
LLLVLRERGALKLLVNRVEGFGVKCVEDLLRTQSWTEICNSIFTINMGCPWGNVLPDGEKCSSATGILSGTAPFCLKRELMIKIRIKFNDEMLDWNPLLMTALSEIHWGGVLLDAITKLRKTNLSSG